MKNLTSKWNLKTTRSTSKVIRKISNFQFHNLTKGINFFFLFDNFSVILLIQPHIYPETRTYSQLDSVNECMEKIIKMYEESLKKYHPNKRSIDYSALDLTHYIDQLEDLNLMVFQEKLQMYVPRNKDWIKEKIYVFLRSQLGILEKVSANSETLGGQKWAPVDHMF